MLIILLLNLIILILGVIFQILPVVTIADIPVIGDETRAVIVTMVEYYNSFIDTFPYAERGLQIFVYVILPFEILMLISKFFLGARTPARG